VQIRIDVSRVTVLIILNDIDAKSQTTEVDELLESHRHRNQFW